LRGRLVVSHLAAVFVGVLAVVLTAGPLPQRFFTQHVEGMGVDDGMMMGGDTVPMMSQLQASLTDSYRSALAIALIVSAATAIVASVFAAKRLVDPIERISLATRRLARGDYSDRVPVPGEHELAMLADDVNTLAETLDATERRRLELINEVAHELRTPLTTIEGYMEGLLDGVFEPTDEVFGATAREAARLKRLASDLSMLSRAEEGALDLNIADIDLGDVATEAARRLEPLFIEKDIDLVPGPSEPTPVAGDRDRLAQVFTNIVGNAITYTPPGGTVTLTAQQQGSSASVTIIDTGKGLNAEDLGRIFDRFQRVDPDLPGGTGVGLTVARSLVRRHGGEISAESDGDGKGSRFGVALPIRRT
jgi:histidine kinase